MNPHARVYLKGNCYIFPNGCFLTVIQSMFTEVEVANQWDCRAIVCPTLHMCFCLWANLWADDPEIQNGKRTIVGGDLYIFITKYPYP